MRMFAAQRTLMSKNIKVWIMKSIGVRAHRGFVTVVIGLAGFLFAHLTFAETVFEEVVVIAEKRNESLQDLSQAVTALKQDDLDEKNIISFVDLSSIAPGVTITKNEGFKSP